MEVEWIDEAKSFAVLQESASRHANLRLLLPIENGQIRTPLVTLVRQQNRASRISRLIVENGILPNFHVTLTSDPQPTANDQVVVHGARLVPIHQYAGAEKQVAGPIPRAARLNSPPFDDRPPLPKSGRRSYLNARRVIPIVDNTISRSESFWPR
jgi:hypothetical protein